MKLAERLINDPSGQARRARAQTPYVNLRSLEHRMNLRQQSLCAQAMRRDGECQICGIEARAVLAAHHIVPVWLRGKDTLNNLATLCANCHRAVHWLSSGERSVSGGSPQLELSSSQNRKLLHYAQRIRTQRLREYGTGRVMRSSYTIREALDAVISRNGFDRNEASTLRRVFRMAWSAIRPADRRECSMYLPRGARFLSVNANNHLALRLPAWGDDRVRWDADLILIWPQSTGPSTVSRAEFTRAAAGRFNRIPYFNLDLYWDEVLGFTRRDWQIYAEAVHSGLTMAKTAKRKSNVVL